MAEYIERERLIAEIRAVQHYCLVSEVAVNVIKHLPSADVVEVVRCWKCKHCDPDNKQCDHPLGTTLPIPKKEDDFCSYGKLKEREG